MNSGLANLQRLRDLINELSALALAGDWEALSQHTDEAKLLYSTIASVDLSQYPPDNRLAAKALITEILQGQAVISRQVSPWLTDTKQMLDQLADNKARSEQDS